MNLNDIKINNATTPNVNATSNANIRQRSTSPQLKKEKGDMKSQEIIKMKMISQESSVLKKDSESPEFSHRGEG
jgi:hypothetical protein